MTIDILFYNLLGSLGIRGRKDGQKGFHKVRVK